MQALLAWVESQDRQRGVALNGPAQAAHVASVEDAMLSPLPTDLRVLLGRHDGGRVPTGMLLACAPTAGDDSVLATLRQLAKRRGVKSDDPELPLPFFRSDEGAVLAFDRSGGPVPDTWPVVDFLLETGDQRLVHRTFDGFCMFSVAEWTDFDFDTPFSLDKYLRSGERHALMEPDVSAAHATAAHALRRAGRPRESLDRYLRAARCIPALPYCDWEALKLAALLGDVGAGLEAALRLCSRAPRTRWRARETTPGRVAHALAWFATPSGPREVLLRLLDQLAEQAQSAEQPLVHAVRRAVFAETATPEPTATRPTAVPALPDAAARWTALKAAYAEGRVRDEDLLLDPAYGGRDADPALHELLTIRREF